MQTNSIFLNKDLTKTPALLDKFYGGKVVKGHRMGDIIIQNQDKNSHFIIKPRYWEMKTKNLEFIDIKKNNTNLDLIKWLEISKYLHNNDNARDMLENFYQTSEVYKFNPVYVIAGAFRMM